MMRKKTKRTRKRKISDRVTRFRHLFFSAGHHSCVWRIPPFPALVLLAGLALIVAAPAGAQSSSKSTHARDFLIFATVFRDQGFALPGARVRVRRKDEKKFHWEAMSDRQGELGIRVPQGAEYEITIEAAGFKTQSRKLDARDGNREDLTIQMERLAGGKP